VHLLSLKRLLFLKRLLSLKRLLFLKRLLSLKLKRLLSLTSKYLLYNQAVDHPKVEADLMEAARPTAAHPTAEVNLELMEVAHQAEANLAVLPAVADHMAEAPNLEVHLIQAEAAALNLEVHLIQAEAAALNLAEVAEVHRLILVPKLAVQAVDHMVAAAAPNREAHPIQAEAAAALNQVLPIQAETAAAVPNLEVLPILAETVDLMVVAAAPNREVHLIQAEAAPAPNQEVHLIQAEAAPNLEVVPVEIPDPMEEAVAAPNREVHLIQAEAAVAAPNLEVVPDPMEEAVAAPNREVHLIQVEAAVAALNLEEVPMVAEAEEAPKEEVAEAEDLTQSMISLHSQWLDQLVLNQLKQHHQVQVQPLQMKFQSGRSL